MITSVLESYRDSVYTMVLNRPERKNALDVEMLLGLRDGLARAETEKAQFVVIRGAEKSFCSGADYVGFKNAGKRVFLSMDQRGCKIIRVDQEDCRPKGSSPDCATVIDTLGRLPPNRCLDSTREGIAMEIGRNNSLLGFA